MFRSMLRVALSVAFLATATLAQDNGIDLSWQPGLGVFNEGFPYPETTVDPATGAARVVFPFTLIPARGTAQPVLQLVYSSTSGVRAAGVGWGLNVPTIERRNPSGAPSWGHDDRLIFRGKPIVPICVVINGSCGDVPQEKMPAWANNWTYFRAQVEQAFSRMFWSPDGKTWRVQLKNGVIMEFGYALVLPNATGPAVDADRGGNIFRWNLVRQYDAQGEKGPVNIVVYSWKTLGELGISYLADIYDTPSVVGSTGEVDNFAHHTHLDYENHDFPNVSHALIWRAVPDLRLKRVDVTSKDFQANGPRQLVRRYHLTYMSLDNYALEHVKLHGSFLQTVQLEGRCPAVESAQGNPPTMLLSDQTNCPTMPPVTFKYTHKHRPLCLANDGCDNIYEAIALLHGPNPNPPPLFPTLTSVATLDANRDGLPDIVQSFGDDIWPGQHYNTLCLNGSVYTSSMQRVLDCKSIDVGNLLGDPSQKRPGTFLNSDLGVSILGYWGNGAGSSVLWRQATNTSLGDFYEAIYPSNAGGSGWQWLLGSGQWVSFATTVVTPNGDVVRLVGDIDGDGLVDALGADNYIYFTRKTGDSQSDYISFFDSGSAQKSNITLPKPPIPRNPPQLALLADMNGDGLADYVTTLPSQDPNAWVPSNEYIYYPGDGTGNFNCIRPAQSCTNPPGFAPAYVKLKTSDGSFLPSYAGPEYSAQYGRVYFHDMNGDGLTDIVWVGLRPGFVDVSVWMNEDGLSFYHFVDYSVPATACCGFKVLFADMFGSGVDNIVIIEPGEIDVVDLFANTITTDLISNAVRDGLLSEISNGLGATTKLEYQNTAFLDEKSQWTTQAAWKTHSERVMDVVTRMETDNNLPPPYNDRPITTYEYKDPMYDSWEQAFLGFRWVRVERRVYSATSQIIGAATETTYFYGHCPPQVCQNTTDDDDWKAVTGLPVVSEQSDSVAGTHLATTVWDYDSSILLTGMDGRRVHYAYPKRTDTWLYDVGNFGYNPQTTNAVVVEPATKADQQEIVPVTLAMTLGRVHIRAEQVLDSWGNVTHTAEDGQIQDDGTPVDQAIATDIHYPRSTESWVWKPDRIKTNSFAHQNGIPDGYPRDYSFNYDTRGNLKSVSAVLTGTLPLDRFHEDPSKAIAPPPPNASVDSQTLQLGSWNYDDYGNVLQAAGPDAACTNFAYDDPYKQLLTLSVTFTHGCGRLCNQTPGSCGPLSTVLTYDRGFQRVVSETAPNGAQFSLAYDAFTRMTQAFEPDPNTGSPVGVPSFKVDYTVKPGGPTHLVHLQTLNSDHSYRQIWVYLDPLSRPLLTLAQADPSAGDEGLWVASGLALRHGFGLVYQTFRPWWYTGDPTAYPIGVPKQPLNGYSYDSFGRLTSVFDSNTVRVGKTIYHALSKDLYDGAQLQTTGPHAGAFTTASRDGHGRLTGVSKQIKSGNTTDQILTKWSYLSTGEIAAQFQSHTGGPEQIVRWMQYDSLGRLVLNAEPNTAVNFSADPVNTQKMKTWRYAYDDAGHLVGTSDARGCGENFFYDGGGRLTAEDFSPCRIYQPPYTAPNPMDGSGTEAFFWYDSPEPGQTQDFGTNPAFLSGQLVAVSDRGAHTRYAWDGRGRLIGIARAIAKPGSPDVALGTRYASSWYRKLITFDAANRVATQSTGADVAELAGSNGLSNVAFKYSARGLLRQVGGSYCDLLTARRYDADGALLEQDYGDLAATRANFTYDTNRNLKELKISRAAPQLWANPTNGYTPPAAGDPPTQQLLLEDLTYGYDPVNNPASISDMRGATDWPAGAKPISRNIQYDDLYRVTEVDYDSGNDIQVSPLAAEISAGNNDPVPLLQLPKRVQKQNFQYDFSGNLSQWNDDAGAFYDRSLGTIYNGAAAFPNQMYAAVSGNNGNLAAHYDAAGNLEDLVIVRAGTCGNPDGECTHRFAYEWDEIGRLSRVRRWDYVRIPGNEPVYPALPTSTPAADAHFAYDARGVRVLKSQMMVVVVNPPNPKPGGKPGPVPSPRPFPVPVYDVTFFDSWRLHDAGWNPGRNDYEANSATGTVSLGNWARVIYSTAGLPSVNNQDQHVLLLLGDPLRSFDIAVDKATSEVVERVTYDAYGMPDSDYRPERWGSFRETYRFTGKEDDAATGAYYFGARYYQAGLGRWISPDPLTVHGLGSDPNPYSYVSGRPLRYRDPFGLQEGDICSEDAPACDDYSAPPPVEVEGGPGGSSGTGAPAASGGSGGSSYQTPRVSSQPTGTAAGNIGTQPLSPAMSWLLYTNNPVAEFLVQDDRTLAALQEGAALTAVTAATIATAGMASELIEGGVLGRGVLAAARSYGGQVLSYIGGLVGLGSGAGTAVEEAEESAGSPAVQEVAQIIKNRTQGIDFQTAGHLAIGVEENTTEVINGGAVIIDTKPDAISRVTGIIGEFKNVQYLSLTRQILAQINIAQARGVPYVLMVGMNTQVSAPLLRAILLSNSIIVRFDPATGTFHVFE